MSRAIQDEVSKLPRTEFPHLESVVDLWNYPDLRHGPFGGAVEGVMLLVLELGALIG